MGLARDARAGYYLRSAMSQTAFVLVLSSDTPLGEAVRDQLRDRYDHSCRVTATVGDAIDSVRARAPDAIAILGFLYQGGGPPVAPFPMTEPAEPGGPFPCAPPR